MFTCDVLLILSANILIDVTEINAMYGYFLEWLLLHDMCTKLILWCASFFNELIRQIQVSAKCLWKGDVNLITTNVF